MDKPKLVEALNIRGRKELVKLHEGCKPELKFATAKVVIDGLSYQKAGEAYGISKHAMYEHLKRLYKKKYGKEYASKPKNIKAT